jgi:hypothetical protein
VAVTLRHLVAFSPPKGSRILVVLIAAALALSAPAGAAAGAGPAPAGAGARARPARAEAPPPTPAQELARTAAAPVAPASAPLPARGPLVWSAPMGIDSVPINGLSCPSIALCVAVDNAGRALSSTVPVGGARTWQTADIDGANALTGVSCPSVAMCVAVDGQGNVAASGAPAGPATGWTVARVDTSITEPSPYGGGPNLLRGVSCPSVSLCVAVDSVGNIISSGAPTGGAPAWALTHIDDNSDYGCTGGGPTCQAPLMGVSCATPSSCSAADFTGNLLQTTTPAAPAPWPSRPATGGGPASLWSLSCPSATLCAAVDGAGGDVITWSPATGLRTTTHRLPIDAFGVWCDPAGLCLASGESANGTAEIVGSSDPAARSPTWAVTDFGFVNAVSCPTASVCLAADNEGDVILGVTVASLAATLRHQALGGRIPKIAALVHRRGYAFAFTSPLAGQLTVTWTAGTTVLGTASARFPGPGAKTVRLKLTGAGRALLKASTRIKVTAVAGYETNTGTVTAQVKLPLSSRR